jgi:arylsulfatase
MNRSLLALLSLLLLSVGGRPVTAQEAIVHDAEYYIIEAQNGKKWAVEDANLDKKLAELRSKFGTPPNIVHFMWDDQPFGAVGIPAMQKIRGYETPTLNRLAKQGILFTRMYTEPGCTPSRAACLTGQHPIRNGMYTIGFPIEYRGLAAGNVTIAEVLSQAGYATGFFGKLHQGDVEESYPHNQGFDEAFWAVYNQVFSLWHAQGEAANAVLGLHEELLAKDPYKLDHTFVQKGYVGYLEGKKGELAKEWGASRTLEDYKRFDIEAQKRALDFIRRNARAKKPFYVAWWPQWLAFVPEPKKTSLQRGLVGDAYEKDLDPAVDLFVKTLQELGIAENTLVVMMSDNGPMTHNPPPGAGLGEGIFRGGKGEFTEGGVRVCAQAWWPGVIQPNQIVHDIIHEVDLYTTFARLAGATKFIPRDRIIDGIDQTSLLVNGDTHGRRDHVFIYTGPNLGATVKDQYKKHWISSDPTASSGIGAAYFDLYNDPREQTPLLINMLHFKEPFNRMRARHEAWIKRFPHREEARGPAYTGIANARPETIALSKPPEALKNLPFEVLDYIKELKNLPFDPTGEPDAGQ